MSLTKFDKCNSAHESILEYCCFKTNKLFCQSCWYREGHPYKCFSSKCGHFEKHAHSIIQKALEIKTMQYGSEMCSSYETFDNFYRCFYRFKETVTQRIKSDIENKMPLFIWTAITEMLKLKNPNAGNLQFEELTCLDMLKVLKNGEQNKLKSLEQVVRNFEKLSYLHQGVQNRLKTKTYTGALDREIETILTVCAQQSNSLIQNLRTSIKKHMECQVGKLLKNYDPSLQFDGIKFHHKKSFQALECYNTKSLYSSIIPQSASVPASYLGFQLQLQKLQKCPEILLQVSKSILKQKIYKIHNDISQLKSSYPYKYGYVICTTLVPDPQYELCVINLERANLKAFQKRNQYSLLNSINVIIMGPQLITIEFKIYPKKTVEVCIFGYQDSREKHIAQILQQCIGLGKDKTECRKTNKYPFETQLSLVQLAYVELELAYEHLFTDLQNRGDFEGEKYVLARGIKLMEGIVGGWKSVAAVEVPIEKAEQEYIPLFI